MNVFSYWQLVIKFRAILEFYGIDPKLLPADMNARICSDTKQHYERSILNKHRQSLSFEIERSATLVALCVLGPADFPHHNKFGISMQHTVTAAAVACRKGGPESTLDTQIIHTIGEAGYLSQDFIDVYSVMLLPQFIASSLESG